MLRAARTRRRSYVPAMASMVLKGEAVIRLTLPFGIFRPSAGGIALVLAGFKR
jgi:hypothetical protein